MKPSTIFVILELVVGLAFGLLTAFVFPAGKYKSAVDAAFYMFLTGILAMFIGVALVGYFHVRHLGLLHRYGRALAFGLIGLIVILCLFFLIPSMIPKNNTFVFALPVAGTVMGFNFRLTRKAG